MTVRQLEAADLDAWMRLWRGYTRFYRAEQDAAESRGAFSRLRGKDDLVGLVAVSGGDELVGLAHLVFHLDTWSAASACYLNDLYVDPSARGGAVADALFDAIYASARERGAERVYWHTQQFNGAARSLYDKVGQLTSFIVYEQGLGTGDAAAG